MAKVKKNIGFISFYNWRPHTDNLFYLSKILDKSKYNLFYFECDGKINHCYNKELHKKKSKFLLCFQCKNNSFSSFKDNKEKVSKISDYFNSIDTLKPFEFYKNGVLSSSATIHRIEDISDTKNNEFIQTTNNLAISYKKVFNSTVKWIDENNIDFLFFFNGRIDHTNAIFQAANHKKIKSASIEKSTFGPGIQIIPNDTSLGLGIFNSEVVKFSNIPLNKTQCSKAFTLIMSRFKNSESFEWRDFHKNNKKKHQELTEDLKKVKILFAPGSRCENFFHKNYFTEWISITDGVDYLLKKKSIKKEEICLKMHPIFFQKIGNANGEKSLKYFSSWAKKNKIVIASNDINTIDLLNQVDVVITTHGSIALEAGILGKQVLNLVNCRYSNSGFVNPIRSKTEVDRLVLRYKSSNNNIYEKNLIIKKCLRYIYFIAYRFPQFTEDVKPFTSVTSKYKISKSSSKDLVNIIEYSKLNFKPIEVVHESIEDKFIKNVFFHKTLVKNNKKNYFNFKRKLIVRFLNFLRNIFPRGDLL